MTEALTSHCEVAFCTRIDEREFTNNSWSFDLMHKSIIHEQSDFSLQQDEHSLRLMSLIDDMLQLKS